MDPGNGCWPSLQTIMEFQIRTLSWGILRSTSITFNIWHIFPCFMHFLANFSLIFLNFYRYLSYVVNVATPTKDCLELVYELLEPVIKERYEKILTRQEVSLSVIIWYFALSGWGFGLCWLVDVGYNHVTEGTKFGLSSGI